MTHPVIRAVRYGLCTALVAAPMLATSAFAADLTPQQQRMKTCSAQNKGKKGDDYKQAQKACLSGDDTAAAPMTQQQKMAMCSKQNKGRKGDDYKKAQSACLSG
jgi:hypothetical protein